MLSVGVPIDAEERHVIGAFRRAIGVDQANLWVAQQHHRLIQPHAGFDQRMTQAVTAAVQLVISPLPIQATSDPNCPYCNMFWEQARPWVKGSKLQALAKIPANIEAKLDGNMKLMDELELSATPAIFYLDDKGGLQQQQGAPSPEKLGKIMGPK